MALNSKKIKSKNKDFVEQPLTPVDNYPCRVVQVIDLGLQDGGEWKGEKKPPVNKLYVTYEMVDLFMLDKDGKEVEDKPRWVSEDLNMFGPQADKAKCNQRYTAIDPALVHDYNWAELVNSPCYVMISHKEYKGKTYANVGTVTPYITSKRNPELVELQNPTKVFDLDNPDMEVFEALPEWLRDKIKGNLEFKGSPLDLAVNGGVQKDEPKEPNPEPEDDDDGEEW
jgi:hypothetical protein